MGAAAVIIIAAAVLSFLLSAYFLRLSVKDDPIDRRAYQSESRSFGWRLSKRFPQGKDDGEFKRSADDSET